MERRENRRHGQDDNMETRSAMERKTFNPYK